jgi:Bax protein
MGALQRIFVSGMAATVTLCLDVEIATEASAKGTLEARSCSLAGWMPAVELLSGRLFEPAAGAGTVDEPADAAPGTRAFVGLGYDLDRVRAGEVAVPRQIRMTLPRDLADRGPIEARKTRFIAVVLPVALHVREGVLAERRALEALAACERYGIALDSHARAWVSRIAERYDERPDLTRLLRRVDAVPTSLLLAQAAVESGWGTSRAAQEANALFGEYTYRRGRPVVRSFGDIVASTASYVRNLNTHPAYEGFRARRATLRALGWVPDGRALVGEIVNYSTRRQAYVRQLRAVIETNRLHEFDGARLARTHRFNVNATRTKYDIIK